MKTIKSKENQNYKAALKLSKKKYRDEYGRYLLEGIKPLEDALNIKIPVERIFLCEGKAVPKGISEEEITVIDKKLFSQISGTENSQGIIAVVNKNSYTNQQFADAVGKDGSNLVVLDRLQDPGNIGTIIRTAEAAGYKGIIVISGTGDIYSPKVVRAAAGSLFRMPVLFVATAQEAAEAVHDMGKKLVVTCLDDAKDCFDADLRNNIALVIGNEGRGVSEGLLSLSDIKVKIPMEGSIESLNAAVAAGILMYQSRMRK